MNQFNIFVSLATAKDEKMTVGDFGKFCNDIVAKKDLKVSK